MSSNSIRIRLNIQTEFLLFSMPCAAQEIRLHQVCHVAWGSQRPPRSNTRSCLQLENMFLRLAISFFFAWCPTWTHMKFRRLSSRSPCPQTFLDTSPDFLLTSVSSPMSLTNPFLLNSKNFVIGHNVWFPKLPRCNPIPNVPEPPYLNPSFPNFNSENS